MISVDNLRKEYLTKNVGNITALDQFSYTFSNKGFYVLLGESGSGKTTLLKIIGGLESPTTGTISYNNEPIKDIEIFRNSKVSYIFQEFNLIDDLTIEENIDLVIQDKDDNKQFIEEVLAKVGLNGYQKRYPNELSGGEQQRIAIARALAKESEIILADEPTGNLNQEIAKDIILLLEELSQDHLIIMATHDVELLNSVKDYKVLKLKDGKVSFQDEPYLEEQKNLPNLKIKRMNFKELFKLALHNLKLNKLKSIAYIILSILSFGTICFFLPIVDFSRPYVDYLNAKQEEWILFFNDSLNDLDPISEYQLNETIPNCQYLISGGSVRKAEELIAFGYEFYDGYQPLETEGIYLSDYYLSISINANKIDGLCSSDLKENKLDATIPNELAKKAVGLKISSSVIRPESHSELIICGIYKSDNRRGINGKETVYELDQFTYTSKTHPYYFYSENCHLNQFKRGSASGYGNPMYKEIKINSRTLNSDSSISYSSYLTNDTRIITKEEQINIDLNQNAFFAKNNEIYLSSALYNEIFTDENISDWNLSSDTLHHLEETIVLGFSLGKGINGKKSISKEDTLPQFVIKGVYQSYEKSFIASKEIIDTLNYYFGSTNIIVKTSSIPNLKSVLKDLYKYDIYSHYTMKEKMTGYLDLILLLKVIGGIIAVFSLILIVIQSYTYISACVQSRTKTIGVFKSLGIPKVDIFKLFLIQFVLITFIMFLLLTPITYGFVSLFNFLLVKDYNSNLFIFAFKPIYILYIFIVVFVLSMILSALVSWIKISKSIHKLLY
ncbi:MAG: ABC transporter ATP-binding protein/permease [Roseburia sp.]|nr:ABC transporter ATP-binding protein/permease [Anaeroplasma bactoclasticum]MCM1196664.1 ABC transporter ATP-binding protein/permease [Roseburia sp.]MCM1557451.1 ABC transporter ATP-binding protein/permease [Anaeroplasma bactoclasticum]